MSTVNSMIGIKSATISIRIKRADGTVEDLGVVSEWSADGDDS